MLKVERVKFEHASKYIYWKNEIIGSEDAMALPP